MALAAIPKNATVGDAPVYFRSEEFLSTLHSMKSQAHLLEAQTFQLDPSFSRLFMTHERPSAHIGAAIMAHHTGFHHEIKEHLMDAADAAHSFHRNAEIYPHRDAAEAVEMSAPWKDFADHINNTLR